MTIADTEITTNTQAASPPKPGAWRDVLPIHPAAELFPLMSEAELRELADDIEKHGLQEKVDLYWDRDGKAFVIDGRNRLAALALIGQDLFDDKDRLRQEFQSTPPPRLFSENDCVAYVISKNVQRCHLTPNQKRNLIAKLLKAKPEVSNLQIAKQVKADDKTVAKVRTELEARSEIPNVETKTDTKGRRQPARKPKRQATPSKPQPISTPSTSKAIDISRLTPAWREVEAQAAAGNRTRFKEALQHLLLEAEHFQKVAALQ